MRLNNKAALVTGAGSGIGRAISIRFAKEGADVAVADIKGESAEETAKEIEKLGRASIFIRADVSNAADAEKMVKKTIKKFGKLDILVNNAGVTIAKPLLEITESDWNTTINVCLKSVFLCSKAAVPQMVKQGSGKIINIASIAGQTGGPNLTAYCAAKGGVVNLTRALALELAPKKINVNAIGPGPTETPMSKSMLENPRERQELLSLIPWGRFGKPEDMAAVAVFLASDDADYITGSTIFVEGGWLIR